MAEDDGGRLQELAQFQRDLAVWVLSMVGYALIVGGAALLALGMFLAALTGNHAVHLYAIALAGVAAGGFAAAMSTLPNSVPKVPWSLVHRPSGPIGESRVRDEGAS